jgi:hypothetical protein
MTPSDLKYHVESTGSHFFDRRSMRFFGDTMANFGVRSTVVQAMGDTVDPVTGKYVMVQTEVWELYRRRAVKAGNRGSFYFRKSDYSRAHCVDSTNG